MEEIPEFDSRLYDVKVIWLSRNGARWRGFSSVMRRWFHIVIALVFLACATSPFAEMAIHWNESIFTTGHDMESTIVLIALLLALAFSLSRFLAVFLSAPLSAEPTLASSSSEQPVFGFVFVVPEASPPLSLRI